MNFDELTRFLEKRLQLPLPGETAHLRMQPKLPSGAPFRISHQDAPRRGGVLILLYENEKEITFPLIQRQSYDGIHSGQVSLPGGRFEEEDGDQVRTALRETNEEIGVDMETVQVIGSLSEFFVAASNYMVQPVIGKINYHPSFVPEVREVEHILSPPLRHLLDQSRRKEKEMVVRNGFKMLCPYFDLEDKVVWGATAMMLSELVEVLRDFKST
ncbi:MAG: CoA pyrophosphatase [Ekhidna sp.]|nr:CoA pyrophosphatase [Ekhidna sp.]